MGGGLLPRIVARRRSGGPGSPPAAVILDDGTAHPVAVSRPAGGLVRLHWPDDGQDRTIDETRWAELSVDGRSLDDLPEVGP